MVGGTAAGRCYCRSFAPGYSSIVSVVCPAGPHPPLRLARRPNRGHIGGGGWTRTPSCGVHVLETTVHQVCTPRQEGISSKLVTELNNGQEGNLEHDWALASSVQHDGWIELSDVEGMVSKDGSGKTINDAGKVKIKTCTKKASEVPLCMSNPTAYYSQCAVVLKRSIGVSLTPVVMELYSCVSRGGKDPMCFRGVIDSTRGDWFVWGGCIAAAVGAHGSAFTLCGCRVQHT